MQLTQNTFGVYFGKKKYYPRILGIYLDDSACSYYRVEMPMKLLADCGYPVSWGDLDSFIKLNIDLKDFDMIVIGRVGAKNIEGVEKFFKFVRESGKVAVVDYDDDFLHIPPTNPFCLAPDVVDGMKRVLGMADGIIVTNDHLAGIYKDYAKRIAVLPNYIDARLWPRETPRFTDKLTVGLTGSPSHAVDWYQIAEPMKRIMERHKGEVEFLVGGFLPEYLSGIATRFIKWISLRDYPRLINSIDIGLCPLVDDLFNRSKSHIKALELGLAKAAVVASPTIYNTLVKSKGRIATTPEEWEEAIELYIINEQRRTRDAFALNAHVINRHDIAANAMRVANTYSELYYKIISGASRAKVA